MRANFRMTCLVLFCLLVGVTLSLPAWGAAPSDAPPAPRALRGDKSTPELIADALSEGRLDEQDAALYLAYALFDAKQLPSDFHSAVPWDGTLPLRQLRQSLASLQAGSKRDAAARLVAGACSDATTALPNSVTSTHFFVEYDTIGGGLTLNQYTASLEGAWSQQITNFGWAAPPVLASNPPPGNRYHVRIEALPAGLYGFVSSDGVHAGFVGNNPNTAWNDGDALASCMVLNRDFSAFPGSAQQALDATTAHEFNHSLQYGYGALSGSNVPDIAFIEGGATWMEDEVFDTANDNYNYLWPNFAACMGEYPSSPYPYWIVLRGLTERYGVGAGNGGEQIMQEFWQLTSQNAASNLGALNSALATRGTTLADGYHDFAIAAKFNKPCGGGYSLPYCFEEGANYVAAAGPTSVHGTVATIGGSATGSIPDNYALNWIALPTGTTPYNITLQNSSSGGQLRATIVCDTGASLVRSPLPALASGGGSATLSSFNPATCSSVVAVITNQAQSADNPTSCAARSYTLTTNAAAGATPTPTVPVGSPTPTATRDPNAHYLYLPMVRRKATEGISGRLLQDNNPAAQVAVELRYSLDPSAGSTLRATALTGADGRFKFEDVPTLQGSGRYWVQYVNRSVSLGRLLLRQGPIISAYTNGTNVDVGTFDITDITLRTPSAEARVSLPVTFGWNARPTSPSDNYAFVLYDPLNPTDGGMLSDMGYRNSLTIGGLNGFASNYRYVWEIWTDTPDGGVGISLEARGIYFRNAARTASPDEGEQLRPFTFERHLDAALQGRTAP